MASGIKKSRHTLRLDPIALLIGCAALSFFSGLVLLCAAGAVAGLVGLLGRVPDTSRGILEIVDAVTPSGTARALRGSVENLIEHRALAFGVLGAGMVGSMGAGVAYLRSFRLSLDALSPNGRPTVQGPIVPWPALLPAVLSGVCLAAAIAAAVLLTGPLARAVADQAAIGDVAIDLWEVLKWPVAAGCYLFLFVALSSQLRDDRMESPWEVAARSSAALAWVLALGAFTFYLIAFDAFADSYGPVGAAALSILWLTLFAVMYLALPLRRARNLRALAFGAVRALAVWAPASALLAILVSHLSSLPGVLAAGAMAIALPAWLWASNLGLLAGTAVRHRLELGAVSEAEPGRAPDDIPSERSRPLVPQTPSSDLVHAIGLALRNEPAHDGMLSVIPAAPGTPPGGLLSELERDVAAWGFTFGVAWAVARSQDPNERDEVVAEQALAAAHVVFNEYMGDAEWAERIAAQRSRAAASEGPRRNGGPAAAASGANGQTGWKELAR